jgi:putative MATE family efflux protein
VRIGCRPVPDSAATLPSAEPSYPGLWKTIVQSLKGSHFADYTALPLNRAVLLLAVPMVMEMMMESLFALSDVFWVSRLGKFAVAAVGFTESVMTLIYAVAIGVSIAATAIVARRMGEKDPTQASRVAGQILMLGLTLALGLGAVAVPFAPRILELMGADPQVITTGGNFSRIMLGGNVTVFMIFLLNAVFRGAGDAVIAMRTLILSNCLNIILGPCFINGWGPFPALGVTGAAVATNLGRGIGVLYQLWHLTGARGRLRLHLADLLPDPKILGNIVKTSASGVLQFAINTTSWMFLFKILAHFGSHVLAGYTIAMRLIVFALLPAWGLSNAGSTLVGQNLGAGRPDRAEASIKIATRFNMIFLGTVAVIYIAGARLMIGVFTSDPAVFAEAVRALWIVSLAFPVFAAGMCFGAAFNGSGDTWTPTWLNFFCFWLGQLPLAWLLAGPAGLGPTGAYASIPISFLAFALWSGLLFRRGKWKQQKV